MNLIGLNLESHKDLKLKRMASYCHGEGFHSASLAIAEIAKAALSYPILFVPIEEGFHPIALLSLVSNENQYLDGEKWNARYIPAAVRIYPFRLAGEQVLVDESAPHFASHDGELLFTDMGEPTPVLNEALGFLRAYHAAEADTQQWCKRLADLGLLVERQVEVVSPKGERYRLEGFFVVDAVKITQLSDAELAALARDGSLSLIYAHLSSLEHLITLATQRDGYETTPVSTEPDNADEVASSSSASSRKDRRGAKG